MTDHNDKKHPSILKRRDMLKAMTAVPAAALMPVASAMAADPRQASGPVATAVTASGVYQRKVLSSHEWESIKVLSDLIIPADEHSGSATQAGVPEFIDDMLNFQGGQLLAEIRGGLTWLDIECNRLYTNDFVACTAAQQKQILDRIAYPRTAAPEDSGAVTFFSHLRDLVVGGFFSSKMGVEDLPYLGNKMLAEWEGCPADVLTKINDNLKAQNIGLKMSIEKDSAKG